MSTSQNMEYKLQVVQLHKRRLKKVAEQLLNDLGALDSKYGVSAYGEAALHRDGTVCPYVQEATTTLQNLISRLEIGLAEFQDDLKRV